MPASLWVSVSSSIKGDNHIYHSFVLALSGIVTIMILGQNMLSRMWSHIWLNSTPLWGNGRILSPKNWVEAQPLSQLGSSSSFLLDHHPLRLSNLPHFLVSSFTGVSSFTSRSVMAVSMILSCKFLSQIQTLLMSSYCTSDSDVNLVCPRHGRPKTHPISMCKACHPSF